MERAWQQSRQVLQCWTEILSIAYALPQQLATHCGDQVENLMDLTPWRKKTQITAGRVRLGLQNILGNVRIREWWNPKYRKFQPPIEDEPPPYQQFDMECRINPMSENNIAETFPPPS